jgi:ABC-type lipoprotein export system ATPase subunit
MIRLSGVEKSYPYKGGQTWVLRQIGLEIAEGDFVTIMGPSGSGKSTLLAILGMLDGEYGGEYWLDDKPVHKASVKERGKLNKENVGFVFQHFHLLDDLTVYENLEIPLSYRDVPRKEREARVAEILDRFQMVGKKDLYPTQLSGGQQQQVAVARAVIANPRVVLADEPTGSLHWSQGEEIMKLRQAPDRARRRLDQRRPPAHEQPMSGGRARRRARLAAVLGDVSVDLRAATRALSRDVGFALTAVVTPSRWRSTRLCLPSWTRFSTAAFRSSQTAIGCSSCRRAIRSGRAVSRSRISRRGKRRPSRSRSSRSSTARK